MAVKEFTPVLQFEDWYEKRVVDPVKGGFTRYSIAPCAEHIIRKYDKYRTEMQARTKNFYKLEKLAASEVLTERPDLPNVSSGDIAGLVRRGARSIVQNTPNVEVISQFDDDSAEGILSKHILTTKIIGSDTYSNDMQQNLFASTKTALTLGFACVVPVLLQDAAGSWYIHYDAIHHNDVFPEDGAKDVRQAKEVFIRRYLTKAEVHHLIETNAAGWDIDALKELIKTNPPQRRHESGSHEQKKGGRLPDGYEIATFYTSSGRPFLTFDVRQKLLLRIEKNKHPRKLHPVHFLVLEKDEYQPLGKSMVELTMGRQEFQDLLLNGAMKMWHWGINPTIIGRGVNSASNLGPGKFLSLSNPNAQVEVLETNTATLSQHGIISQQNLGAMVSTVGAADQQMAASAGNGMSATPQGVEAQTQMVDITTNNYQKAVENFFSHYCSYALTVYFQELSGVQSVTPNAEARKKLLAAGLEPTVVDENGRVVKEGDIDKDGAIKLPWEKLAVEYFVRCVPGSLTELEDEKQLRILNEMFIPLSQAMPAIAQAEDPDMIKSAVQTMQYILGKQIQLSGATDAPNIARIWYGDDVEQINERDRRIAALESRITDTEPLIDEELTQNAATLAQLQAQVSALTENFGLLLEKLGVGMPPSGAEQPAPAESVPAQ